ncbi:hypothetical protein E2562_024139 [Oryza meyeriana var. granulata]|uniref:Uncharacterized protein n=1 Tax=Oryza meyeriana var. granulata TaxID=110450 RepID=A0A6G1EP70_9ORYZ|nr:hypothetical protein E2562_024139 [Oryza meyeriana var. granulata]
MPGAPFHDAFLIYDTIRKSLSMIPSEPVDFITSIRSIQALITRGYEDHESYALALLCEKPFFSVDGVIWR